jgi:hypothetical protein
MTLTDGLQCFKSKYWVLQLQNLGLDFVETSLPTVATHGSKQGTAEV